MSLSPRVLAPRLRHLGRAVPARRCFIATPRRDDDKKWPQRTPIGEYYESIANYPIPYGSTKKPEAPTSSTDPKALSVEGKPATDERIDTPAPKTAAPADHAPARPKPKRKLRISSKAKLSRPTAEVADTTGDKASPKAAAAAAPPPPTPEPEREKTPEEKARIIFGTRLAGPEDRAAHFATRKNRSTTIAGVVVPPEPEEPDNCCMSGCVNCVWEMYREDMEEYRAAKSEADRRLAAQKQQESGSMDDDGGGSESNWAEPSPQAVEINGKAKISNDMWDDDLFHNVPVGIREFMKQEKKLREKHEREGRA
ncbi:Oxidoreductase-like protein, N-terminal [Geosmithia morbida]|uniref:Oxidoreductase-like protein, N-terminal n=1 Tax=Geosmithia morbida TaxID=1094350 RepID=A0A9P4YUR3_9HYPO|nr:Oxidoreductase-like protein, N-terminal [Geosmithia morbida]KAF4122182.1 Oxidoreductase-like protein, N-terminal [Geosmithia morbida]